MNPKYVLCRGGAYDNERWPLTRHVVPGHQFSWDSGGSTGSLYAVLAEITETNLGPMWVATPA